MRIALRKKEEADDSGKHEVKRLDFQLVVFSTVVETTEVLAETVVMEVESDLRRRKKAYQVARANDGQARRWSIRCPPIEPNI